MYSVIISWDPKDERAKDPVGAPFVHLMLSIFIPTAYAPFFSPFTQRHDDLFGVEREEDICVLRGMFCLLAAIECARTMLWMLLFIMS